MSDFKYGRGKTGVGMGLGFIVYMGCVLPMCIYAAVHIVEWSVRFPLIRRFDAWAYAGHAYALGSVFCAVATMYFGILLTRPSR